MGLDPTDPDFECGNDCATCNPALWGDCTPKYVWANVTGLKNCPIYAGHDLPNGSWKLTQDVGLPCRWHASFTFPNPHPPPADQIMHVVWNAIGSVFTMNNDFPPFWFFFASTPIGNCITEFDNEIDCDPPGLRASHEGHCTITFGPQNPCGVP